MVYLHGIQSHPGWFAASGAALARAGCEVFHVTRRGSGASDLPRGDSAGAGQLLEDVHAAVEYVRQRTGRAKVAGVGVSWGGKLLAAYALGHPESLESLTLVAPGLCPRVGVPLGRKLVIVAARLCCPRRTFPIPLSDVELFTSNPAMRAYLRSDELQLHRATPRFLVASVMLDRRIAAAPTGALDVPTTLILAERDKIIDNERTVSLVSKLTAGRARIVQLPADHTIEFEPDVGEFFDLLTLAVGGEEST